MSNDNLDCAFDLAAMNLFALAPTAIEDVNASGDTRSVAFA